MATTGDRWAAEHVLAAFDEHLRRTRGLCAGSRRNYGRYAQAFWRWCSPTIRWMSRRSRPGT
jgi:hypothetical protein